MAYCPQCGAENPLNHRACTSCGTHLQSGQTPGAFGENGDHAAWEPADSILSPFGLSGSGPTPQAGTLSQAQVGTRQGQQDLAAPPSHAAPARTESAESFAPPVAPPPPVEAPTRRATEPERLGPEAAATYASAQPHSSKGRLIGFLVSYDLNPLGSYFALHTGTLRVGRKDAAPSLDLAIEHPTVSSNHALLHFESTRHVAQIEDTESANGTLLNDMPIAGAGRRELRDGDRLRFGAFKAIIKLVERP